MKIFISRQDPISTKDASVHALTHKQLEKHTITVATDALVLMHQVINTHSAD